MISRKHLIADPFGSLIYLAGFIRARYVSLVYPKVRFRYLHLFAHINCFKYITVGSGSVMLANSKINLFGSSSLNLGPNTLLSNSSGITIVDAKINVGTNFSLNECSFLEAIKCDTFIGNDVRCGKNVHIGAASHKWKLFFEENSKYSSFDETPLHKHATTLGDNLWLCSHSLIVAGSHLRSNSILEPFAKFTYNS